MWKDLSMAQKAEVIQMAVKNGIRDLDSIRSFYDESIGSRIDKGGNLFEGGGGLIKSYTNPETTEGAIAKLALQIADPTGISSWPDVYQAGARLGEDFSLTNLGSLGLEVVGALPLIGKVTAPFKAAKTAKLLKRVGEASTLGHTIEKAARVNKAIDTVPELIPGVRKIAEKVQDATTKYVVDPIFLKMARQNKLDRATDYRRANHLIDLLNTSNTGADFYSGIEEIVE